MPVVVAAVEAVEVVVIKAAVEECVDETIIIVIVVIVLTEDNNYIVYPLHVAVVAVANDDLHIFVLFVVEDSERVKVVGQGGTSPHSHRHHRHHSGYREQQNDAPHKAAPPLLSAVPSKSLLANEWFVNRQKARAEEAVSAI